jgi:hypothetical protein
MRRQHVRKLTPKRKTISKGMQHPCGVRRAYKMKESHAEESGIFWDHLHCRKIHVTQEQPDFAILSNLQMKICSGHPTNPFHW